jgi:7,8-dihydropterin-6-yl-methyl-4-(beta-D-ribofuranosyl)aminobenzene 5'-phosphate synthase
MKPTNLRESEKVEVTILVDNYTDLLLQSTDVAKRNRVDPPQGFLAEHGFSCLIQTTNGREERVTLMDVGVSGTCLLYNARLLGIDLGKVEALVLSHSHFDHTAGLREVLPHLRWGIPLVLHPDAFLPHRANVPVQGILMYLFPPEEKTLRESGVEVRKVRDDSTLASGALLVLGEIERTTEFEKGMPGAEAEIGGRWVTDPFLDDRGVAVNIRDKGLVVIGGCSHAGIVNTVRHAQKATGVSQVHAVLGGFHLTGPMMEPVIGPTVRELKKIGPHFVVPGHCTGWAAMNRLAAEMPEQFILNTVGTTYIFE